MASGGTDPTHCLDLESEQTSYSLEDQAVEFRGHVNWRKLEVIPLALSQDSEEL